jgi:hypothetical protein
LHQFDPVAIGVGKPRRLGAVGAAGAFHGTGVHSRPRQRSDGCSEVFDLDDQVAEPGADVDRAVSGPRAASLVGWARATSRPFQSPTSTCTGEHSAAMVSGIASAVRS